jgi:NAD(P)-dependent dehydrogenase (short-subunit alcohol dehydrogenase family)
MFTVKEFFDIEDADWQAMFELNVMSAVRMSRALMPPMLARGWGRIVFIGSDQSSKPNPSMAHYAMTKTAMVSIARSLAERTRGTGVTVNTVQVAPTWTDGVNAFMHEMAEIEDATPEAMSRSYFSDGEGRTSLLQRWAKPEEIAAVVAFLCSPLASAINGSAPRADGGMVRALF